MQLVEHASAQKLRGAYYTPPVIASFILRWGLRDLADADILEPSCGDGVFLEQLAGLDRGYRHVTAVEIDEDEARKAGAIGLHDTTVINADFHRFCLDADRKFSLVIGNPPFIRYQYYSPDQQDLAAEIFKRAGLKRSKLTNAWVTFVVGCSLLIREQGRLGFVVPSDLLQVSYARQLRQYLAQSFNRINIVSFKNLVFEAIQQDVVLLLCERNGTGDHLIEHIEVRDADELGELDVRRLNLPAKKIDFHADKWNYYFLDSGEIEFIGRVKDADMPKIGDFADVEVGITTGSNGYFTVPRSVVEVYGLQDYARPMVGRSVQVNSVCFTADDWRRNSDMDAKANLLVFPPGAKLKGGSGARTYIESGENIGVNKGYKTGIRDDWYVIPSIKLSDALFLRRNNLYPKFVLNEAHAYTTDTMHRVFIHEGVNHRAFVASYYNSLSLAFAEILGRNFGGGVLELMPSEVEGIYLPYRVEHEKMFEKLDCMVREKQAIDEILDFSDRILLGSMGFSDKDIKMARSIWRKLSGRRLNRGTADRKSLEASVGECAANGRRIEHPVAVTAYPVHCGKPEQLHLAIEKRKGYKVETKRCGKKAAAKGARPKAGGKPAAKAQKSVKARYAKHG